MSSHFKESKSPIKKVFDVFFYLIIGAIIVVSVVYTVTAFSTQNGVTSVFGYVISSVQSGSMSGTFEIGDIIVTEKLTEDGINDLKEEDIISFYFQEPQTQQIIVVTHRIIEIQPNNGKIVTQGDVARANKSLDNVEYVSRGDIIAKYNGFKIAGLGKISDFIGTSTGFFCCVLIPVFLFLFWQIYVFAKALTEARKYGRQKEVTDEARALAEKMLLEMQINPNNIPKNSTNNFDDQNFSNN